MSQWLMPVMLASPDAGIRRMFIGGQHGPIVQEILSPKYQIQKSDGRVF
jgi:hypothetical protein